MGYCYGIDFGTTNSAIVMISELNGDKIGEAKKIGEDEYHPLPSFVAIHTETGDVKTGLSAKNTIVEDGAYRVFSSIKTVIDEEKEWEIAGRIWKPVDIATELFKSLKNSVTKSSGDSFDINEAVVAVPVGFSSDKKNAIRLAAKNAGIKVKMFISEPTAAYCSRLNEMNKYKNVVVFDWGGGTLDVVALRIDNKSINELASVGMSLAGNDIDKKIAEKLCLRVARKTNQNFKFEDLSSEYQLRLLNACENAKCNLSDEDVVTVQMSKLDKFGRMLEKLDYDYFYEIIENEVEQAVDCLLRAISEAGMNRETIDCIICEGGSSRLRPLQSKLLEYFEKEKLLFPKTAMWDIASGAAEIAYRPGCYKLSRPIGIIQSNMSFYPLMKAGQAVPTDEKIVKFGVVEKQEEARFVFVDGDTEYTRTFEEYFPVKLRGYDDEVLKVSYYVDTDMIFKVKIHSNRMPDDVYRVWTYSNLKVTYDLDAPKPEERK